MQEQCDMFGIVSQTMGPGGSVVQCSVLDQTKSCEFDHGSSTW